MPRQGTRTGPLTPVARGGRRGTAVVLAAWCALAPAPGGALGSAAPEAPAGRNNYYSYRDPQGVLHVTNVPHRKRGAWTLHMSLPGSGGSDVGRGSGGARPGGGSEERFDGERAHRYDSLIEAAAARYQLPPSLLRAVMRTESNFHRYAVSSAGAMGLMQLMPATAKALGVDDAFDPRQNVFGGARFLRMLANRYDGDMVLVAAAYNAGPGNVDRHGGVPPFAQTRAYVRSVLRRYYAYERQAQLSRASARRGPARHLAR